MNTFSTKFNKNANSFLIYVLYVLKENTPPVPFDFRADFFQLELAFFACFSWFCLDALFRHMQGIHDAAFKPF